MITFLPRPGVDVLSAVALFFIIGISGPTRPIAIHHVFANSPLAVEQVLSVEYDQTASPPRVSLSVDSALTKGTRSRVTLTTRADTTFAHRLLVADDSSGTHFLAELPEALAWSAHFTLFRKLLKVATDWGVIAAVPCSIRLLPRPQREAEFWDFEDYGRLAAAADTVGPNARMVVSLGGLAGLRMGEIIALRWQDVDLPRRFVWVKRNDWRGHLDKPKGGREARVDLCNRLRDALQDHRVVSQVVSRDGRVLCREDGSALTERGVRRLVERSERLAVLPNCGVHALRHTFGAHLAMRGASPKAIQELMRHADLSMTQRYTHLSPAARESAVRLLDLPVPAGFGDIVETAAQAAPTAM